MAEKGIQLHSKWTFVVYCDGNPECSPISLSRSARISSSGSQSPTSSGTVVGTFSTVQDFWRYWNNIDMPSFPKHTNIQLFKSDIPIYADDPGFHDNGGKWVITQSSREEAQRMWLLCILALIGEQFEYHSEMYGTVLSFGPRKSLISIWNRSSENKMSIGVTEQELYRFLDLASGSIRYQTHQGMLDLGRRKVGIKLSASLDLGTTSSSSCRLENKKSEADEDSSNKGETDLVPRFSVNMEDDDFSTPFIELAQLAEAAQKPKLATSQSHYQTPESSVKRLHPSPGHRRSQSAGNGAPIIRCQPTETYKAAGTPPRLRAHGSDGGMPMTLETKKRFAASTDAECSFGSALNGSPLPPKHKRRGKKRSLDAADPLNPRDPINRRGHRSSVCNLPSQRFKATDSEMELIELRNKVAAAKTHSKTLPSKIGRGSLDGGNKVSLKAAEDTSTSKKASAPVKEEEKAVPRALGVKLLIPLFVLLIALCLMLAYAQDSM